MVSGLPRTGAISMTTPAKAARTYWLLSMLSSRTHGMMLVTICWGSSSLEKADTFPAAATRTSASPSRSSRTKFGVSSILHSETKTRMRSSADISGPVRHRFGS
jgi:hypothetical protein